MEFLLNEILKNGMYVKCALIGKLNILTTFKEDLYLDEHVQSEINGSDLIIKDNSKPVLIVSLEEEYIRFFPSPDIQSYTKLNLIQCIFDSFVYTYSGLNEDLIELEESGMIILPINDNSSH